MPILPNLEATKKNDEITTDVVLNMFNKKRNKGFETSLESFNKLTGGIRLGTLTILGAFTGMGKTLLTLNIVNDLLTQGIKVFYADLENGAEETLERLIRIKNNLPVDYFDNIDNSGETMTELVRLEKDFYYITHELLNDLNYEKKGLPLLIAIMEKRHRQEGIQIFVIDPLQALERSNNKDTQLNEQGTVVKKLKEFAQRTNTAVIINHHIRKSVGGSGKFVKDLDETEAPTYRLPTLDDLKGSGKISDYATDVWAMVRTIGSLDDKAKGNTLFRVLKSRRRTLGDCKLWLDIKTLKFYEKAQYEESYVRGDMQ